MKNKIVSFGDSFVFGSELKNNDDGSQAWPAHVARELEVDYQTMAVPGCGNENISRQVLEYFSQNSKENTLAVINWTWAIRWDFYIAAKETWVTLGPTCVPQKLEQHLSVSEAERVLGFYQDYASKSILWDRYRSLQTMFATQQYLKIHGIDSVQTYMDYTLFDRRFHAPHYIQDLQNLVRPSLLNFGEKNFLDWSREQGFTVTEPGWHPLEEEHQAAAQLWKPRYEQAVKN
jgi:hypothetical protein